jgi:hypothetical protein
MKMRFTAIIVQEKANAIHHFGHLYVIATDEEEARKLVEQHLFEQKPLGFSEREMRKRNPKRTPSAPGLRIGYFFPGIPVEDGAKIGVVND